MKHHISAFAIFACTAALGAGCASTASVSARGVNKVKTAAVISYVESVQFSATSEGGPSMLGKVTGAIKGVEALSGESARRGSARAERAYDELRMKIGQVLRWNVLEAQTLRDNGAYTASYNSWLEEQPSLVKASMKLSGGAVPGVMWAAPSVGPSMQERDALMQALGLDAAIIAQVTYRVGATSGFAIGGVGNLEKHPQAYVRLMAFARGAEEPIWQDDYALGEATEEGIATITGGIGDHTDIFLKAADSGLNQLMRRYQAALAKAKE